MTRQLTTYAREVRRELGKVTWPSRQQLLEHAFLVIGVSLGLAVFLGAVDYLAALGFEQLLRVR